MRYFLLGLLTIMFLFGCTSNNEEEYYHSGNGPDTTSTSGSLIAHIPVEGELVDITGNILLNFFGDIHYTQGIDGSPQGAVVLDGEEDFILAFIDAYDSVSISLWFLRNADTELEQPDKPTLIDYSSDGIMAYLDAVSGGTYLITEMDAESEQSSMWVNSFYDWSHLYIEITGNALSVNYLGQSPSAGEVEFEDTYSPSTAINLRGEQLFIGRASGGSEVLNSYFKGALDDIRVYNRFLTGSEILTLRNEKTVN